MINLVESNRAWADEKAQHRNNLSTLGKFSISPEECARRVLKGVARNKPIIVVTGSAKIFWWPSRISPTSIIKMTRKDFNKNRDKGRIAK